MHSNLAYKVYVGGSITFNKHNGYVLVDEQSHPLMSINPTLTST